MDASEAELAGGIMWATGVAGIEERSQPDGRVKLIAGVPEEHSDDVAAAKQGDGGAVFIHGSAELARRLSDADLIDRYHLLVFPVLLGAGKALFSRDDRDKRQLRLRESASYSNGVAKLIYDVVH